MCIFIYLNSYVYTDIYTYIYIYTHTHTKFTCGLTHLCVTCLVLTSRRLCPSTHTHPNTRARARIHTLLPGHICSEDILDTYIVITHTHTILLAHTHNIMCTHTHTITGTYVWQGNFGHTHTHYDITNTQMITLRAHTHPHTYLHYARTHTH